MENKGINNSKLIKQALRFYRDYGSKVKQLDSLDIENMLDNPQVKKHIGNIVEELLKGAISNSMPVEIKMEEDPRENIDSIESDYMKKLNCVKDMS